MYPDRLDVRALLLSAMYMYVQVSSSSSSSRRRRQRHRRTSRWILLLSSLPMSRMSGLFQA